MEAKGLCISCVEVEKCIFHKQPLPVLQCEEFSSGNSCAGRPGVLKVKKAVFCETAVESE